jgi:hypothetical protein
MKIWSLTAVLFLLAVPAFTAPAPAIGAPMICHEFEIGGARSLPWEKGEVKYDRTRLAQDVAEVLKTETDLVVRMETLRRAVIYTRKDKQLAWELLGERSLALLDQTAIGSKQSAAWFDVAYLVACFHQAGIDIDYRAGVADRIEGYGYFKTAIERARAEKSDQIGTIEFAAALAAHPGMFSNGGDAAVQERYRKHLEAAKRGAQPDSLLEKNLTAHVSSWKGHFGL